MSTYSTGTSPTDANKLADIQSVLNKLPNNTSKLIAPKDVRDAVFTLWENVVFKPTTAGGTEYIGIDQSSFKEKIFLGKKMVSGQYVMNNNLLSTDVDVFFYNTKTEPQLNYNTKVAFLAGTSSNYKNGEIASPYLQSTVVENPGYEKTINFEILNPSYYTIGLTNYGGDINIKSDYGLISLNGIIWPDYLTNNNSSLDGNVLKFKWISGKPYATWEILSTQSVSTSLYSTGTVSITGSPVLLNGDNINFSSSIPVPATIGGIVAGSTFSDVSVVEMIRMLLYSYIAPTLSATMSSPLLESGSPSKSALRINYTIVRSAATYSLTSLTMISGGVSGSLITAATIPVGTTSSSVIPTIPNIIYYLPGTQSYADISWTMRLTDITTTKQSTATLKVVIPWYYGTSNLGTTQSNGINTILGTVSSPIANLLTPLITNPIELVPYSAYNKSLTLSGQNVYLYFAYPADFPDLVSITDSNGVIITTQFKKFVIDNISTNNWGGKSYKFYIYVGTPGSSVPMTTTIGSFPYYSSVYNFNW
jgi:hypothetical protein